MGSIQWSYFQQHCNKLEGAFVFHHQCSLICFKGTSFSMNTLLCTFLSKEKASVFVFWFFFLINLFLQKIA